MLSLFALVLVLGVGLFELRQLADLRYQIVEFISSPATVPVPLDNGGPESRITGKLYAQPGSTQAVLIAQGLHPLEEGRTYQL